MNKKSKFIFIIPLVIILIGLVYFIFIRDNKESDSYKFSKEYSIGEDNVFVYESKEDILKIMKNGTGVVYLGFPECPWCKEYVIYLNEVAKENKLDKIYYYNILNDRKDNTDFYKEVVSLLSGNLQYDDEGNERIYVPNVSFHVNGKVIGNDYETSKDTHNLSNPKEYWTSKEVEDLKSKLNEYTKEVVSVLNSCTSCNK